MRKILLLLVAAVVGFGSTLTLVAPAQAAPAGVTIKTIADPSAAPGKKTTIKARYSTTGKVTVTSARLTVRQGTKVIASKKKSVAITVSADPSIYSVTTVVKYKVKKNGRFGKTKTKKRTQDLFAFACATSAALKSFTFSDVPGKGTTSNKVGAAIGYPQMGSGISLGELYEQAIESGDQATQAEVEQLYVKGWDASDELVTLGYARCGSKPKAFTIEYLMDGDAPPRAYQLVTA